MLTITVNLLDPARKLAWLRTPKELWRFHELLFSMVQRISRSAIRTRFSASSGRFLDPLITVLVMTLVFQNFVGDERRHTSAPTSVAAYLPYMFLRLTLNGRPFNHESVAADQRDLLFGARSCLFLQRGQQLRALPACASWFLFAFLIVVPRLQPPTVAAVSTQGLFLSPC